MDETLTKAFRNERIEEMKTYTAVFMERTESGDLKTFGIEMHLTKKDSLLEAKQQAEQNNWRFIELRNNN